MFRCYLLALLVVPLYVLGQSETKVGINLPSLAMGTVDLQGEMKLAPSFWLQMGAFGQCLPN